MSSTRGILHLIPVTLGSGNPRTVLPQATLDIVNALDYFIVENEKSARQFLKDAGHPIPIRQLVIEKFDKDSTDTRADELLQPLLAGRSAGLLSEAGCPAIADPGALLAAAAHRTQIRVAPHIGPSALFLALMASGFNGQNFAFHGYLPVDARECRLAIENLERESRARNITQIFIETPYRNDALLGRLLEVCNTRTRLCVASNLTLANESVYSATIADWKKRKNTLDRQPSVFVLYAG